MGKKYQVVFLIISLLVFSCKMKKTSTNYCNSNKESLVYVECNSKFDILNVNMSQGPVYEPSSFFYLLLYPSYSVEIPKGLKSWMFINNKEVYLKFKNNQYVYINSSMRENGCLKDYPNESYFIYNGNDSFKDTTYSINYEIDNVLCYIDGVIEYEGFKKQSVATFFEYKIGLFRKSYVIQKGNVLIVLYNVKKSNIKEFRNNMEKITFKGWEGEELDFLIEKWENEFKELNNCLKRSNFDTLGVKIMVCPNTNGY